MPAQGPPAALLPGPAGGSAAQLLNMLGRPEVVQALLSMLMGSAGRPSVSVPAGSAGTQVPVGAIASMLGALAHCTAEAAEPETGDEAVPAYLLNRAGEAIVDIAVPEARAEALIRLLDEAEVMRAVRPSPARRRPVGYPEAVIDPEGEPDVVDFDELVRERLAMDSLEEPSLG